MPLWPFNVYMDAVMKELKMGIERRGVRFQEEEESRNFLASCMEMAWFCVVSRRKI